MNSAASGAVPITYFPHFGKERWIRDRHAKCGRYCFEQHSRSLIIDILCKDIDVVERYLQETRRRGAKGRSVLDIAGCQSQARVPVIPAFCRDHFVSACRPTRDLDREIDGLAAPDAKNRISEVSRGELGQPLCQRRTLPADQVVVADIQRVQAFDQSLDDLGVAMPKIEHPSVAVAIDEPFFPGQVPEIGSGPLAKCEIYARRVKKGCLSRRNVLREKADRFRFAVCTIAHRPLPVRPFFRDRKKRSIMAMSDETRRRSTQRRISARLRASCSPIRSRSCFGAMISATPGTQREQNASIDWGKRCEKQVVFYRSVTGILNGASVCISPSGWTVPSLVLPWVSCVGKVHRLTRLAQRRLARLSIAQLNIAPRNSVSLMLAA